MRNLKVLSRVLCALLLCAIAVCASACDSTPAADSESGTDTAAVTETEELPLNEKIKSFVTNGIDKYAAEYVIEDNAPKSAAIYMAKNEDEGAQVFFRASERFGSVAFETVSAPEDGPALLIYREQYI